MFFYLVEDDLDDLDDVDNSRLSGDMFSSGQPLDREPNMGQVPVVPPGTPPMDSWPHFSNIPPNSTGFIGRQSPNIPMSNHHGSHLLSMETMAMVGGGPRMMAPDINDNNTFSDYPPHTQSHVEVY